MIYTKLVVTSKYYNIDLLQNSVIADIKLCGQHGGSQVSRRLSKAGWLVGGWTCSV